MFEEKIRIQLKKVNGVVFTGLCTGEQYHDGPFPSCCLSRFRSESWCSTIERELSLICIRMRNSEMGY